MDHLGAAELLAVVALAIIVAPTLAGWLRLPGIIGLVLAGALVGPYMLGLLPEGAVDALGAIGLLYLMFQAGLEIDLATFRTHRRSAVIFGLLTFILPFVLGMAEGLWLGYSVAAAALLGSIWASHTLVTLPDVREAGIGASRAVTTVSGATVLTDTLALLVLAVVAAVAQGGDAGRVIASLATGLIVLVVWTFWVLPKLGARYFVRSGQERVLRFAWLLFALASAAVVAEFFGIEGLVGAFLAGLGTNRLVPNNGPLMERVDFFGAALLVPAFLVYVGTKLDPSVALQISTVRLALLFVGALLAGKGLAAFIGGRLLRFSPAEWGLMLGMSVPQAAATLAAAIVGEQVGLFGEQIVNAVVVVVLFSVIIGSLMTRFFARRVEMPAQTTSALGREIVLGLGGHEPVAPLARLASALALADDGTVVPVTVSMPGRKLEEAERLSRVAEEAVLSYGADAKPLVRSSMSLDRALLETVAETHASSLLITWTPSDASWLRTFGSQVDRIGRESTVPVIAAYFTEASVNRVVLATDSVASAPAQRYDARLALQVAAAAADSFEAELVVQAPDEETGHSLSLPEAADLRIGGSGETIPSSDLFSEGTLLVITAERVRRTGGSARTVLRRLPGVSVLVVGGPHRLRLGPLAGATARDYLGYRAGAAADVAGE